MKFHSTMIAYRHELFRDEIFVFGSNTRGIHGAGAALIARRQFGAKPGIFSGMSGRSYAIPTRIDPANSLTVDAIEPYVRTFLQFAADNPNLTFFVTRIGCGLAGHTDEEMAPLFKGVTDNCIMPEEWKLYLT